MTLDPLAYLQRLLTDLAFDAQVRGDARRTIICHPDDAPGMQAAVDQLLAEDIIKVKSSPIPDRGTAYVIDDAALEASQAEAMQRMLHTSDWWYR